jgi:signal peptidase II
LQPAETMNRALVTRVNRISRVAYVMIAAVVFAGDQATKALVERSIPMYQIVPIIPHFLNLTHSRNAGAAFGLFSDSPAQWKTAALILISVLLLATVLAAVLKSRRLQWETGVALALILGGALSNLVDRARYGRVTDFLDFYFRGYHWFTFNLADSAIVVGAGFMILQLIFGD